MVVENGIDFFCFVISEWMYRWRWPWNRRRSTSANSRVCIRRSARFIGAMLVETLQFWTNLNQKKKKKDFMTTGGFLALVLLFAIISDSWIFDITNGFPGNIETYSFAFVRSYRHLSRWHCNALHCIGVALFACSLCSFIFYLTNHEFQICINILIRRTCFPFPSIPSPFSSP